MRRPALINLPLLDESFPLPLDRPFTATMAREHGVTANRLSALVRRGLIVQPIRRVYLAAQAGDSLMLRAEALRLVVPEDAVICDRHAGWLHGAEMVLAPNEHLHLAPLSVFRPAGNGRLRNKLTVSGERNLSAEDVSEVLGLPVTTPLRTAHDLGRLAHRDRAIAGLDAMLRLRVFDHAELLDATERFRGMRGVRQLRELAPLADGRAESPGESVLRLRWHEAGLPTPEPQLRLVGPLGQEIRLDLGIEPPCFAAEYDGEEWHSTPAQRAHDEHRRGWLEDRSWVIRALRRHDVYGQHQAACSILRSGFEEARRRYGRRLTG